MDPEFPRPRLAQRTLIASVLHLILVGVLAPGLILGPLAAIGERSLVAVPVMIGLTFILSWWITIPVAVASCACYAMARRIRRASVAAHAAVWALIGGLSAHAWTLLAHMDMNPILAFDGIAALSGVVIGISLFYVWRLPKARMRIARRTPLPLPLPH